MNDLLAFLATAPGSSFHVEPISHLKGLVLMNVRRAFADGRAEFHSRVCKVGNLDKEAASILKALRPEANA